jgi:hypothetical protein
MIRPALCSSIVAAALTWAGTAAAFEPIAFTGVPDLVGKEVFAGVTLEVGSAWVYAGEPLLLVAAPARTRDGQTTYPFVRVKTAAGKEADVPLRALSRTALRFDLRNPGTAHELALAVLADAYEIPARMHELRSKRDYKIDSNQHPDEYHQADSLAESFKFQRQLLHNLIHGSHQRREDVLREEPMRWLAAASNDALLAWYTDGVPDKKLKTKLENAVAALNLLDGVASLGFSIARLETEKAEKPWRRRLADLPEDKLAKLDAENAARIDADVAKSQQRIKEIFAQAAKSRARVK